MYGQWRKYAQAVWVMGILVGVIAWGCYGQEFGAGDAAHFLRDGIGARSKGMGGAFVAIADDVTSTYWNPAGLIQSASARVGGTYENRYGGLSESQYLAGTLFSPTIGAGFLWVHSDIYSVYSISTALGLGKLALGITGKLYSFSAPGQRAGGVGIDLGSLYRTSLGKINLAFGITSADISWSKIQWQGEGYMARDHVAWVTRLGAAVSSEEAFGTWGSALNLEVALRRPPRLEESDYFAAALQTSLDLGIEILLNAMALRAGLADIRLEETGVLIQPVLGLGIQVAGITFDVAWIPSQLGHTYTLSMEAQF